MYLIKVSHPYYFMILDVTRLLSFLTAKPQLQTFGQRMIRHT